MPKQRFDNKPMNRVAQAAGDDKAVLLKQETDPTNMLELNRRHGSVRVDDKANALGVVVDGDDERACWFSTQPLTASASWTISFSLKVGLHLDSKQVDSVANRLPILSVVKDNNNYWEVYSEYNNATTCTIKAGGRLNSSDVSTDIALDTAKTQGTVVNLVLTYDDSNDKFIMHSSTDAAEEFTKAPVATDKFTVELLGNSVLEKTKVSHVPHVISNLAIYTGAKNTSDSEGLYADRTPTSTNLQNHYLLSAGGQAVSSEVTNDTDMLLCDPSPPVAAADSIVFNGRSSALRVQMTQDIEQFFTAKNRSALFSASYTFYLKGTLLEEGKAQTLLDFDDLGVLAINSSGHLTFTVSGTTHTYDDGGTLLTRSNPDFEIFATKTADERLYIIHDGDYDDGGISTIATWLPPYFDMNNPPKLWVGSAAADTGTKYCGTLTKFAMYKGEVTKDLGATDDALVYMEGASFVDKSTRKTGLHGLAKSDVGGSCSHASGPLDDGSYVAVAGGHVLGEGNVTGFTKGKQRMALAFKKDAEVLRIGSKLLVASGDVGHVIDEEAESVREYGVPSPWRNVSVQPTAPGVLEGAASYGYRYVTSDGTYGPIRRLDPSYVDSTAGRFIIGSSSGADDGVSEMGETFIKSTKGGHLHAQADSGTTDIFGTVNDEKRIVVECFAKVEKLDVDEMPETIWGRGLQSTSSNGNSTHEQRRQYWRTGNFQMDLNQDFAIQTSFKYSGKSTFDRGTSYYYNGYYPGMGIFSIGERIGMHRNACHGRSDQTNPAMCAYLMTGGTSSATSTRGKWARRVTKTNEVSTGRGVYGNSDDNHTRLVIGIARERYEHFHQHGSAGLAEGQFGPQSNMKWITFTDASECTGGTDNDHTCWQYNKDYSLFVVREDDDLKVYVHNATDEKWHVLVGRTMEAQLSGYSGHGGTSGTYSSTDFFAGWSNPGNPDNTQFIVKGVGSYSYSVPPIGTDGQVERSANWGYWCGSSSTYDRPRDLIWAGYSTDDGRRVYSNHELMPMLPEDVQFHARAWSVAPTETMLREHGYLKNSAQPGGALYAGNVIDAHFDWSDNAQEEDHFVDSNPNGNAGLLWNSYRTRTAKVKAKIFEQEVAHAETKRNAIFTFGNKTSSSAISNMPLALYYSNRGAGSITLQTMGKAAYTISNEEIPGGGTDTHFARISDHEFVNDFHEWNMYSIQLRHKVGDSSNPALYIEGMAINGNVVFDTPIMETDAQWTEAEATSDATKNWIHIGGSPDTDGVNNDVDVYVGEFRIWADGQGPKCHTGEPGPNGWNVSNRVAPDDWGNLLAYWRMIKGDLTVEGGTLIKNVGTASGSSDLGNLELDNNSMLQDEHTAETGTNAVAFPELPRPDIAAIELFRTITQGIVDIDVEDDVQKALDSVRYAPLYFLARVPSDTKHFIDDTPNSALGFAAPWTDFAVPDKIKQFFTWQGQVGVIGENNRVYYTEPGPFGWETFPYDMIYDARVSGGGGASELVGCRSTGDTLYLFGQDWTTALIGAPGNETEFPLGGGVGAYSPRASVEMSGQVYAFNGRLWLMDRVGQVDFKTTDVGTPFQDLLPTHSNVRLACSTNLQSLFIIDENTGDVLRLFIPTGEVTVEKRYALAVGDSSTGTDQWVNVSGSYSTGNTSVYGDDVQTDTPASNTGTISGAVFTTDGNLETKVHKDMRIGIVDSAGSTQDTTISAFNSTTITVAAHDSIADGAATIYFGASSDGMIVDSGYIDTGAESSMINETQISIQSGSGVEVGFAGSPMAGTRTSIADAQFVTVAVNDTTVGGDVRGRFLRGILRNRKPEATAISHVDIDITVPNAQ
tara:strand:- start:284 stop:5743 length:5460 start_codon:yes stop_codon:yes gene_type:complete